MKNTAAMPIPFASPNSTQFPVPKTDFRFEPWETQSDVVTPVSRGKANLSAIQLLKRLETERPSSQAYAEPMRRAITHEEQVVLSRFTGYGSSAVLAQGFTNDGQPRGELAQLLTPAEVKGLLGSSLNAHYTSLEMVRAIWRNVSRLYRNQPPAGLRILEPAVGTGNFLSCMPPEFQDPDVVAIELEAISAAITRHLHPSARVFARGFEAVDLPNDAFDLVIGNWPFGNYRVADSLMADKRLKQSIHNYFFAKAMKVVKPGGIVVAITSRFFLDGHGGTARYVREWISERADLLAMARLPNTAFKASAGTEVTTDVLVFRKRLPDAEPVGIEGWLDAVAVTPNAAGVLIRAADDERGGHLETGASSRRQQEDDTRPAYVNRAYLDHPEWVLGELRLSGKTIHGAPGITVVAEAGTDASEELSELLKSELPFGLLAGEGIPRIRSSQTPQSPPRQSQHSPIPVSDEPELEPGIVRLTQSPEAEFATANHAVRTSAGQEHRLLALQRLYAAAKTLGTAEYLGRPDDEVIQARTRLNAEYDAFHWTYGRIHDARNMRLLKKHFALPYLLALETETGHGIWAKTPIFHKRTIRPQPVERAPQSPRDALVLSLWKFGRLDLDWMAQALGTTREAVIAALQGQIFFDPDVDAYVTDDEYLSGNVRRKLRQAQAAAALVDPRFEDNVRALEAVLPPRIKPGDITAQLGANWIPPEVVGEFVGQVIPDVEVHIGYVEKTAIWEVKLPQPDQVHTSIAARETYGTARLNAIELLRDLLNSEDTVIWDPDPKDPNKRVRNEQETLAAQARQQALKEAFTAWVWTDEARATQLADLYNDRFNAHRARKYDGAFLDFPGLNVDFVPWPHQKNGVWRVVQSTSTLLAHEVGAGKTSEAIIATAELLRMGLIHKALFVVPNHIIGQWADEFARLYPHLRVVCAGEDDLKPDKRGEFLARVATGDADVYVVMHSQFRLLPVRPETLALFIQREVDELEDAIQQLKEAGNASYGSLKDMQRSLKNYYAKLDELATMKHDDAGTITFDELGIDLLVIDEFHLFKNLQLLTRRKRISGMSTSHSQRAYDMYVKMTLMAEASKRRLGLTATPVTNTMLEVFTMQRFFQKSLLEELGIDTADAWMNVFTEAVTGVEVAPTGKGFRLTTRLAKWHNLPELAVLTRQVMDVVSAEDLKIPKPALWRGKPLSVVLPRSRRIDRAMDALVARAETLRATAVDPAIDNILKIIFEARCLSLDPRLLAPGPEEPSGKVNAVAQILYLFWRASAAFRGTQMVFCDLGVPSTKRAERPDEAPDPDEGDELVDLTAGGVSQDRVYGEIKRKLVAMGVPAHEIAFIHDAKKRAERQALFKAMNEGRVRILIGSTEKMGTGTNAQKRLIALHNLDIAWRPDQMIQRIGRIERQGNDYDTVFVLNYLVEGTFDAYMLQTQENKARFITQFTAGEITSRTAEDVGDFVLSCAEMKALASGDPRVQRRVELEARLQRLDRLHWAWTDARWKLEMDVRGLPGRIEQQRQIVALRLRAKALHDDRQTSAFVMQLKTNLQGAMSKTHSDRIKAGEHLVALANEATHFIRREGGPLSKVFYVGEYLGFDIWLHVSRFDTSVREVHLHLGDEAVCKSPRVSESSTGSLRSLEHALRQLDADVADAQDLLGRLEKQLIGARAQLGADWEYRGEYTQIAQELAVLKEEMDRSEQNTPSSTDSSSGDAQTSAETPSSAAVAMPETVMSDEADPLPSANVLASQVLVREAVEAVWEMHRERYALTGEMDADENEPVEGDEVVSKNSCEDARQTEPDHIPVSTETPAMTEMGMVPILESSKVGCLPSNDQLQTTPRGGQLTLW